ncbi:MAG: hypothetical protein US71_C0002G0050 [Parcubacteria group bacterium GW2011_GWD2_38_12]|nr:MAG: hypothetical protein US06_C0003G0008 [Parcubacteria group bacterium GW2011_GWC2_36_17]KKQ42905.1 MAG: hypothetical protein US61_C0019G0005 [Parcubacteria group bacterium GW2011_GWE2_37_8]KKQ52653.1 MAG: hypothetical protein US71_C0002G0050 [Parcubacteria group bacterium GW2011_GWD2_38_12]KKQ58829.1 MAG: hypothetical protein US79_C0002G0017 [Parcubacteria group bacterium GW2011_GWC1_38_17]KKQ59606.1 MAG: hypothetical protein US78_C0002G0069 [Parcubacteria group bacterium GW2011_GWD1_38_1
MLFQISKPEITNIWKATWDKIKIRWQFWSLVVVAFISHVTLGIWAGWGEDIIFFPFIIVVLYVVAAQNKIRTSFWKRFAELNGWQYAYYGYPEKELGLMFKQGNNRAISNVINGGINDRQFRIFNYEFSIGSGKTKQTYCYTVFVFKFKGSFPHIYLNNRFNYYGVDIGEKIPLPREFEKKFSLSAPKKYEIEALEIFTPDVLANLLDNGFTHDVEFIDQEVLIFTYGQINKFEQLEKEFKRALELEDLLDEKLDKFKFQPIGNMPHILK